MRRQRRHTKLNQERFEPPKVSNTGIDPTGSWAEFVRNDVVQNIDVHRDLRAYPSLPSIISNRPAIGCTKIARTTVPDKPKVPYVISTDRISFAQPEPSMKRNLSSPSLNLAESGWEARKHASSSINCQSTKYNIINFQEQPSSVLRKTAQIDARRLKGLAEFEDLATTNLNPGFQQKYEQKPRAYHLRTGIFTHVYDAAARHGYITMPFETNQSAGGKPAFKC
jgi:hypothetical protein